MPKTIAITPSWYWPENIARIAGIPPFAVHELCVERGAQDRPDSPALICGDRRLTAAELADEVHRVAASVGTMARPSGRAVLRGEPSIDAVLLLLGSLAAGLHVRVLRPDEDAAGVARDFGTDLVLERPSELGSAAEPPSSDELEAGLREAAVAIASAGGIVNHSQRSLLAGAIGLATFLHPQPGKPWLTTFPLGTWEGLISLLLPLFVGSPLVLASADAESFAAAVQQEKPAYALHDLAAATRATREARREVKRSRGILEMLLLSTPGVFESGDRQRVGRSFQCPALTLFGLPETGAIFASHPSWYVDESVGIPVSNSHVVPADPRTGVPIQTLWEQVESAEVTVKGPTLLCGYEGAEHPERFADGRFRTGVIASSDANGMIYLLPD